MLRKWQEWGLKKNGMYGYLPKQKITYRCGGKPLSPTKVIRNDDVVQRTTGGRNTESGKSLPED